MLNTTQIDFQIDGVTVNLTGRIVGARCAAKQGRKVFGIELAGVQVHHASTTFRAKPEIPEGEPSTPGC